MTPWQTATLAVLALTAVLSSLRVWRQPAARGRRLVLLLLQPAGALALYFALYPPLQRAGGDTLVVLTADAAAPPVRAGDTLVALPEAHAPAEIPLVPDLASALRRYPQISRLRVIGEGLPARDREAVGERALAFERPVPLAGIVQLTAPTAVAPGNEFELPGRLAALPGGRVELLDPAGQRMDAVATDAQGRFTLAGRAGIDGDVLYTVRALDAAGRERDRQPLPVRVATPPALKLWILAGAPQPEWKFLRRWATDAGLSLHTQIATGGGLQLGDAPLPLSAATLDGFDLLWLDDRALVALSRSQREAIVTATRRGLGVLVRLDGPLDAAGRQALAQLGVRLRGGDNTVPLASAGGEAAGALPDRRDFAPVAPLAVLAHDARSVPYAWWWGVGQGRIGVTTVVDSWRLVLAGRADAHARLWSAPVSTLARARRDDPYTARVPDLAWAGERMSICGVPADAWVRDPAGAQHALLADTGTGVTPCAAYWPAQTGWHVLVAGAQARPFHVRDPVRARAWHRQSTADATAQLRRADSATPAISAPGQPGSRWPAWAVFVALLALCAWLERRRGS